MIIAAAVRKQKEALDETVDLCFLYLAQFFIS
jgi:hypothetical protein